MEPPPPLPIAQTRRLCGRDFIISETRTGSGGISALWQALPGTAGDRPRGFRVGLFQPASAACLSIISERQPYSSDAIADLERRARLRPPERGWIALRLAEAIAMPRIPYASQILATLERMIPSLSPTDQEALAAGFVAGLGSEDALARQRCRQMLQWMLEVPGGRAEARCEATLRRLLPAQEAPGAEEIRRLLERSAR